MRAPSELLDRGTPDSVTTDDLPLTLAAEVDYLAGRHDRWTRPHPGLHWGVRARALAASGDGAAARRLLEDAVGPGGAEGTPVDAGAGWTAQGLVAASWAASRAGSPGVVATLDRLGEGLDDGFVVDDEVPLAPAAQVRGLLAAARGDLDAAVEQLDEAVAEGDSRAPVWGAVARVEQARILRCRALVADPSAPDLPELRRVITAARAFFTASGCSHLDAVAAGVLVDDPAAGVAAPGLGHLVEDDAWTVGFGVAPPVVVRGSKGLVALRHLVRNPRRGVPAVEIDHVLEGDVEGAERLVERIGAMSVHDLVDPASSGCRGSGGEAALRAELLDDRARSRVTKLLRRTIERVGDDHRLLATHLAGRVGTGYVCRYDGDGTAWRT